ncbi:MAG TPA: peptidylprolyl isomerase [Phaeodactylibacter sp.]|nr:peptidylprolyl isomerase [Phaeodactylibacter sp.]
MIKKLLLLIALTSLSCQIILAQQRQVIDKIIARVGSEIILLSELEEQYNYISEQQGGILPEDFRCQILDNLLANSLLLNQAKLDSIPVSDEEVETELSSRFDQILNLMNGDPKQFEDYYGLSIAEMKEKMRSDLRNQMLVERMRQSLISDIKVTPAEVRAFFQKIPLDSLPYFNSEVEIAEIVYKPKVNDTEKEKARKRLQKIRQRILDGGENFAELAKLYSDDPGSGRGGGDLGWAKRGSYVPAFEAAAYNLEKGEISDLIETEFGFHIIQLLERRGNNIHLRHILIKPEITNADLALAEKELAHIRDLILADSISFSEAVKKYSDENQQSYTNSGNLINPATGNTFFEIGDLEPEIYFTIDTMEVGDISAPFAFRSGPGETAFRIVKLKSRTRPHKASLDTDYTKIKTAAIEQKKSQYLNDWVRNTVGKTYIKVDDFYQYCPLIKEWTKSLSKI